MYEDNQTNESALELRLKQVTRYVTLGLLGVLALCALLFMYIGSVKENEKAAISNSQVQADQTKDSDTCKIYPDQELCVLARKIAANPTEPVIPKDGTNGVDGEKGDRGEQGERGRGVTSFVTNEEGNLIVTFSDGQTQNAGRVVGADGIDGTNGKDGKDGINGTDGTNGVNGLDGRGILSAGLDSGNLIIRYTDGTTENVGMVVGPAGQDGKDGQNGTNGADGQTGPAGPAGQDGVSVVDLQIDSAGYVQVTYSNGHTASAGRVIVNTITSMICNTDTLTITMVDGQSFSTTVDCTPDASPVPPGSGTENNQSAPSQPLVTIP